MAASASDAFHVVIPSMPGYGFSGKPTTTGWDPEHIARAWTSLMNRLGYKQLCRAGRRLGRGHYRHDGRAGTAGIARHSYQHARRLSGRYRQSGRFRARLRRPVSLPTRRLAYERLQFVYQKGIGYALPDGTAPADVVRDCGFSRRPGGLFPGSRCAELRADLARLSRDNPKVSRATTSSTTSHFTWLTNTAISGARLYWENWGKAGYFNVKGVSIPVAVSVFPDELYPAPRSWAERAFPKLIHYNKMEKGGHFAAWEQPKLFTEELRAGFRSLRKSA